MSNGRVPVIRTSPQTEHNEPRVYLKPQRRYHARVDRPLVTRVWSIAVWYDGERVKLRHLGNRVF